MTTPQERPASPMRYRKVRIAWSLGWGLVAVMVLTLWVRSFWWMQITHIPISDQVTVSFGLLPGVCGVGLPTTHHGWETHKAVVKKDWGPTVGYDYSSALMGTFVVNSREAVVPCWFLFAMTVGAVTAPWLHWSKRFSLRTLLIATTLLGVVLGLWAWAMRG